MGKEFWLTIDDPANVGCPCDRGFIASDPDMSGGNVIHVIEKSAYDRVLKDLEKVKLDAAFMHGKLMDAENQIEELKAIIDKELRRKRI